MKMLQKRERFIAWQYKLYLFSEANTSHYIYERRERMTPYKRFTELCENHKVSAYRVAKETGITQSTFSDWKKGRYTPKIEKLVAIANYFEVPVTEFIEDYSSSI